MKTIHYVKKYNLGEVDKFNHNRFAVDFGQDFMSRLEVYKTFNRWGVDAYFDLITEMRKRWELIDLKCKQPLPETLWGYIHSAIFLKQLDNEFPELVEGREAIYSMNARELKQWINDEVKRFNLKVVKYQDKSNGWTYAKSNEVKYKYYEYGLKAGFEWDREYQENVIGSLGLKPDFYWEYLKKDVDLINDYLVNIAFDELTYQLKKIAAARAKIQFNMYRKRIEREKDEFDWRNFMYGRLKDETIQHSEYHVYFQTLGIVTKDIESVTRKDVMSAFRDLVKKYHSDKNPNEANTEKFVEVVEAKNKCEEFLTMLKVA